MMKKNIICTKNENYKFFQFELSDEEVCKRIYECLSPSNPELKVGDICRGQYSREYVAKFRRSDGEEVHISVGVGNLKRYFGALVLGFKDGGIWIKRRSKNNSKTECDNKMNKTEMICDLSCLDEI